MVGCCHEEQATPFCPECGKALECGPLVSLLNNVAKHAKAAKSEVGRLSPHCDDRARHRIQERYDKWSSWESELRSAILMVREATKK